MEKRIMIIGGYKSWYDRVKKAYPKSHHVEAGQGTNFKIPKRLDAILYVSNKVRHCQIARAKKVAGVPKYYLNSLKIDEIDRIVESL